MSNDTLSRERARESERERENDQRDRLLLNLCVKYRDDDDDFMIAPFLYECEKEEFDAKNPSHCRIVFNTNYKSATSGGRTGSAIVPRLFCFEKDSGFATLHFTDPFSFCGFAILHYGPWESRLHVRLQKPRSIRAIRISASLPSRLRSSPIELTSKTSRTFFGASGRWRANRRHFQNQSQLEQQGS